MKYKKLSAKVLTAANQKIKEKKYWLSQLSGKLVKSYFQYDYNKDSNERRMETVSFRFTCEIFSKLTTMSNGIPQMLHMILATGLVGLLNRHSGNTDIIIGCPIYEQDKEGEFINTMLALRNCLQGNMTFKELLFQVRQTIIEANENQNYPLTLLQEHLNLSSTQTGSPLFDIAILLENIHNKKYIGDENPNIIFSFLKTDQWIDGILEYNALRYHRESIERIITHFTLFLRESLFNVDVPISCIDLLSEEEKNRLLFDFDNTEVEYPRDKTIHRLFEEQVARTPDHISVIGQSTESGVQGKEQGAGNRESIQITYRELNEKSNRLAHRLRTKGVKRNTIVSIMMERSIEMIVGIPGILKAGGAYLPIEPDIPGNRLLSILEDTQIPVLLTETRVVNSASTSSVNMPGEVLITDVETRCEHPGKKISENPGHSDTPSDLAYIIFTSGSTGRPKGAMIEHRNVVRLMFNEKFQFDFNTRDIWTLYHSYAFDFSVWEMYGALLYGGKLIVIPRMVSRDFSRFQGILKKQAVTVLNQTPSAFYQLMEQAAASPGNELNIRYVIFGGEALNPAKLKKWTHMYPGTRLINMYGITETTVHVTYKEIEEEDIRAARSNIGTPIPTLSTYVVDRDLKLLPIGVPGELCVGGKGVCRGYLNRPELTNEKFVKNPYKTADRLYRSGDLVRLTGTPGNMEYLGRIDHQVKIRGFRIELGEIQSILVKYRKIKEVVLMARDIKEISASGDKNEGKYLCAYLVATGDISLADLHDYLSRELPDYMIPAQFVTLEKLPLTPNGKVDLKALPSPRGIALEIEEEYAAPKNEIEQKLVEIWKKTLGKDSIGVNDSFFMIGGDSIIALQLVSRMKKAGYGVEIKDILQYPTISELVPRVKTLDKTQIADQSTVTGDIPLTPIQKNFFNFHGSIGAKKESHHYNQTAMLYSKEGFTEDAIKAIFLKIHQHHDALRMKYKDEKGTVIQTNHGLDYPLSLEVYDFRGHRDRKNARDRLEQKANEIQSSIDLEKGPLMKLALFRLEDGDRLLIIVHHLVIDGVSWRILFEDINTLNQQYKKKESLVLPLKTDSFKTWAEKLGQYANSSAFLKEAAYWAKLESPALASTIPIIPKDFEEEDNYIKDTQTLSMSISKLETAQLFEKVNHAYGTEINDILLTALGLGLKKTWGLDRVLIALEGHGRENIYPGIDISRTIGWFTCIYPVLLDLSYSHLLSRQIKEIKETLRGIPGNGIGYGILKYLTAPGNKKEVNFSINPQLSFNYLGQFDADVAQTSFTIARESSGNPFNPEMQRQFHLEINGMIAGNRLTMTITFNKKQYKAKTIQTLIDNYKKAIEGVISHCSHQKQGERTPSDFTYKELSIETLEQLNSTYCIEDIYLLAPMQEGMLFHALYEADTRGKNRNPYFEQLSYRLHGNLQPALVEKSVNELMKRYDVLRTAFVYEGIDRPIQMVLKERKPGFSYVDLRHMKLENGHDKETFIKEFKAKDRQHHFNLSKDVLMRVALIQVGEHEYEFIWSHHHILMDGWCIGILISDYFEIYNSYLEQRTYQLPPVNPYRSYLQWLDRQNKEKSGHYWKTYLESYDELTGIPQWGPGTQRVTGEEYKHAELAFLLDKESISQLHQLTAKNYITVNTFVQTVWGIMLGKYNGKEDVVFGAVVSGRPSEIEGVESMVGLFINTVPVRIRFNRETPSDQLLRSVQQRAIQGEKHHYFPLAEIQANTILKQNLIDHIMIFENYPLADRIDGLTDDHHNKKTNTQLELSRTETIEHTNYDLNIAVHARDQFFQVTFNYNGNMYEKEMLEKIARHFKQTVRQILNHEALTIGELSLLTGEEKAQLLFQFNDTRVDYPEDKSIIQLFAQQVEKKPLHIALSCHMDLSHIYDHLDSKEINSDLPGDYEKCCFKKNPYIFLFQGQRFREAIKISKEEHREELVILKTHQENYVVVNHRLLLLLDDLDGQTNLKSLAKMIGKSGENPEFLIHRQTSQKDKKKVYVIKGNEEDREILKRLISLVKVLYHSHLINLTDYKPGIIMKELKCLKATAAGQGGVQGVSAVSAANEREAGPESLIPESPPIQSDKRVKSPLLLLGDTTGTASTGILYLTSFLRRKKIDAYCQWYDHAETTALLKKNVKQLLTRIKPRVVGISMKWFPHIARVLEISKIVKEHDTTIEVVVGGNTASYYRKEVIDFEWIDYVVCGDGEVPLLKICLGEEDIPNCVYKKDGKIIQTPMSYVQDETNSTGIYLSGLKEILVSQEEPYWAPFFYINTGKGCSQSCFYCGGCSTAQLATYNRAKPFLRGTNEVRKDIIEAKKYTSTFLFDFDLPLYHSLDYYQQLWDGIDLSDYFCIFYFWKLPSPEFIDLVVKTFKYARMDIDLCSLSERHRLKLTSLGVVKPQPTDEELFSFFDTCDQYNNIKVVINHIVGLPYFDALDIEKSSETISKLMLKYSCLQHMDWGRLHAQPGAPLMEDCKTYDMHSYAKSFQDFLQYSQLNIKEDRYPTLDTFHYPYIYFNDDDLNSRVSNHYYEANQRLGKNRIENRRGAGIDAKVTYRQLDEKAHQLAGWLKDKGTKPGMIAALMMERSIEMTAAIMGILKAGGVYLPIDPEYPRERIAYMLKDSRATILITRENILKNATDLSFEGDILVLTEWDDQSWPVNNRHDYKYEQDYQERKKPRLKRTDKVSGPEDLAYVIYTSGSTGKPKGVMVNHGNVVSLVSSSNYIDYQEEDRLLLTGAMVFDITTFEMWAPLLNGISLYLLDQNVIMDADRLGKRLMKDRITILHLIPQLFNQLAGQRPEIFAGLRYFLVGGDMVNPGYINKIRSKFPQLQIRHMYGPTENTTFSTYFAVKENHEAHIPIGTPISNSTVYILDLNGHLQPIGAVGELCVGGAGVARGYLNQPELTAEKFDHHLWDYQDYYNEKLLQGVQGGGFLEKSPPGRQRHPSARGPNKRTYKTGDLARCLSDGNIEFLGRRDYQVKIRGFRIELGEIESQLLKHPHVLETAVIARGMTPFTTGGARLTGEEEKTDRGYICAYIIPDKGFTASVSELREFLSTHLPDYMIPSYFVTMKKFPLTTNGKIDRNSLPAPEGKTLDSGIQYSAPRNPLEKVLVEIWESVLGRRPIGINENFFMIGGDSIKAIQVSSRLTTAGYKAEIRDILKHPILMELAPYIKKSEQVVDQLAVTGEVPLTPVQRLFFAHFNRAPHYNNQAVMLYSKDELEEKAIRAVFTKIQEHHDALRMTYKFPSAQPGALPRQIAHGLDYPLSLQAYDFRNRERQNSLTALNDKVKEIQASISLEKGPLMKLGLFHLADGSRLLIVIHHLVIDGVSWRILFEDIGTLYEQYQKGETLELPPKTHSFKSWVEKLTQYANSDIFLKEKTWWTKMASNPVPRIKKDFDVKENYFQDVDTLSFRLNEEETANLLTRANIPFGTEINDILLTALGLAIGQYFGHNRLLLALESHGREELFKDLDINRTVGWFTSIYPVVLDLSYHGDLARQIIEVKETLHQVPHHGIGYGILKYLTDPQHKKGIDLNLEPQISFNYLGQFDRDIEQMSLSIASESTAGAISREESREYEIDVSGMISNNRLEMSITYNKRQYKEKTMETLLGYFETKLTEIISLCAARHQKVLTPSDLTYKGLSIDALDQLKQQYDFIDLYPLSPLQEGILFHELYDPSSSPYFVQISYRLQGTLDIPLVKKSLNEILKRFDILRTIFCYEGFERPMQLVLKERESDFHYHDIRSTPGDKKTSIEELKVKDRQRVFDLTRDVMMRLTVIRVDNQEYEFIWSHHHIVMEGWCGGIVISEFSEIYHSYLENRPYHLPEVKPYRTYIQWLEHQDKELSRHYWRQYLEGYPELAGVPGLKVKGSQLQTSEGEPGYKGERTVVELESEKIEALNRLAGQHQVTMNNVMKTIWGIMLARYNRRRDVVFGAVVSGRPPEIPGVETMVGVFINTIPVRIRFRENAPFNELIQQVQEESINSELYHYYPLADIQAESALKQNLINHIFVFENYPMDVQIQEAGLDQENKEIGLKLSDSEAFGQSHYDFHIILLPGEPFSIEFRYNGNLYQKELIKKLGFNFSEILRQVAANPHRCIREITMTNPFHSLLPAQEGYFAEPQQASRQDNWNIYTLRLLEGQLQKEKVDQVLRQLLHRHESLRTCFTLIGSKPKQRVLTSAETNRIPTPVEYSEIGESLGISSVSPGRKDKTLRQLRNLIDASIRPYDLNQAPLWRMRIIQLPENGCLLILNTHRLIADAPSHHLLLEEFLALYNGGQLPGLKKQYSDFLEWHSQWAESGEQDKQREYWFKKFAGDIPPLVLPTDFRGEPGDVPGLRYVKAGLVDFEIDNERTAKLKQMTSGSETAADIVLLCIFNIMLSMYTGQEDFIVGISVPGRPSGDFRDTIGSFTKVLGVRSKPRENETFLQLLKKVKENVEHAYQNQDYPFTQLANTRRPLFNVVFETNHNHSHHKWQDQEQTGAAIIKMKALPVEYENNKIKYDLILKVSEDTNNLRLTLLYPAARFKRSTIERMAERYKDILAQITADKNIPVKDISLSHGLVPIQSRSLQEDQGDFGF